MTIYVYTSSQSTEEAIMWYEVYSIASDTGLQHLCSWGNYINKYVNLFNIETMALIYWKCNTQINLRLQWCSKSHSSKA